MTQDPISQIGTEQIDAILAYLPLFETEGYTFGQWVAPEGQFPYFQVSDEANRFIHTLYEQNMIIPFDWGSWTEEAERYRITPAALQAADLLTIRQLLTAHVRADRFHEGHLAAIFDESHLTALLRRLKMIRDDLG